MTQVFISYSRKDLEFVDRLANDLKATGFEVWYDLSGLEAGTRWGNEIQKAIQESQFFLVVLSPNSIKSDWVEREFLYASDQNLKIIPLLYQPCNLPMWSLNLHFIDMQGKNYALHYQDLLKVMGIKKGLEENPIVIRYIEIGDEYRKRGQASQAIESYQMALNVDPGSLKARTNIGAVHLMEQEYSQAVEAYQLALQISSEDLVARAGWCDANMALGNQARAEGRLEAAIQFYLEILRIDPNEPDARQSLVNIYTSRAEGFLAAGQEDEALGAFSEAIKYSPDDPGLALRLEKMRTKKKDRVLNELMARSEAEVSAGNWDQALDTLNEALDVEPQNTSILKKISNIQSKQLKQQLDILLSKVDQAEKEQRWDAAMTGLKEYLHLKPDDTAIQKRMADLMQSKHAAWLGAVNLKVDQSLAKRDWDAALSALNEALQLEPDNKELLARATRVKEDQLKAKLNAMIMRADQAASAGRWDDALEILNAGLISNPDNTTLKSKLSETLQAKRKHHLQSILIMADAKARAGKWESALNSLNEVLAEEPDNPVFLDKYNHILALEHDSKLNTLRTRTKNLLKEQKFEEALAAWNEILLLEPENHQTVLDEIEAVNKAQKLESSYSEGVQAFEAKDHQAALDLLSYVLQEQPGYKDAAKLLAKTRKLLTSEQKKTRTGSKKVWVTGITLTLLALGISALIFWLLNKGLPVVPAQVATNTTTSTITAQTATPTPLPGILNPANQHQYLYVENNKSWQDARDYCVARGGYLVTIQDAAENQFVYDLTQGNTWLGATDENEEGNWTWVSGESWTSPNWGEGQPDNDLSTDPSGESFLGFVTESPLRWNDFPGHTDYPFTCEWDPSYVISIKYPQRQTLTITSAEDSGSGTLRQALLDARAGDIITFDPATFPPDDPVAINLYSALPVIDQGYLTVDASNAGVVLNGSHAGGEWTAGIDIWTDHNIIKGLGIIGFSGPGIALQANADFNILGGDRGLGMGQIGEGIFVGANSDGVAIWGSDNVIMGNLVGILGADSEDLEVGNRASGIFIADNASRNTIGPDNIIAYNGISGGGCGIDLLSLDAKDNNLTANIIYGNEPDSAAICYKFKSGDQFVNSTPPTILYFDLESGIAAGQTTPYALVEIFSTGSQDAQKFEGWVEADEFGNFVFRKSAGLTGPFLTATSRNPSSNTSEISLPTPQQTDLMIALDKVWVSAPVFETSFSTGNSEQDPNSRIQDGKFIISSETGSTGEGMFNLSSDKLAIEVELRILKSALENSTCYVSVQNNGDGNSLRSLGAGFRSPGLATLEYFYTNAGNFPVIASGNKIYDFSESVPVKFISIGEQIAVFIDGQIAYTALNPDGSTIFSNQYLVAENSVDCEFDNYKLWDLSGVNLNP